MEVVAGTSTGRVVISQLTSKKIKQISLPLYDPVVTSNYPPNEVVAGTSTGHVVISQLTSKKHQTQISLPLYDREVTASYPRNGGCCRNFNRSCGHKPINFQKTSNTDFVITL